MKQKENIFEELGRMKNLIYAKAGTVISEQAADIPGDVGKVMRELSAANTNETNVVNILKNYKTKQDFQNFVSQYEKIVGKKLGAHLRGALSPTMDTTEWNDLKSHLSTIGITLNQQYNSGDDSTTFGGLTAPAAANLDATYSCIKAYYDTENRKLTIGANGNATVVTRDGKKVWVFSKDKTWSRFNTAENKIEKKGKWECIGDSNFQIISDNQKWISSGTEGWTDITNPSPATQAGPTSRQNSSSVNSRFASSVKSLGIQGDKMDLQTLQSILKTLEGGQSTAATTGTPAASGTPDLAQLTAALNQL